jgi:hypothetical protein
VDDRFLQAALTQPGSIVPRSSSRSSRLGSPAGTHTSQCRSSGSTKYQR